MTSRGKFIICYTSAAVSNPLPTGQAWPASTFQIMHYNWPATQMLWLTKWKKGGGGCVEGGCWRMSRGGGADEGCGCFFLYKKSDFFVFYRACLLQKNQHICSPKLTKIFYLRGLPPYLKILATPLLVILGPPCSWKKKFGP